MYRGVAVAIAVAAILVPGAAAAPTFVIVRDVSIGGFARDGTVRQAIIVFGQPVRRESLAYDQCRLSWPRYGVTMETYYTNATLDPCGPRGRHTSTTVTDRRWRTSAGLKIGDSLRRLRELYPRARVDTSGKWRLTTRTFAGVAFPGLEARVVNGRVVSFTVYGPRSPF